MREIIRFNESDCGKKVKFSPHENSIIYEQCLVGKVGVVKKVTQQIFTQQITVDFGYTLKFADYDVPKKMVLSSWAVQRKGYERSWQKGCAPKLALVMDLGHVITPEEKKIYNNHYQHWKYLEENIEYTVVENENEKNERVPTSVTVSYRNPTSFIGPVWRVNRDNLIWAK